MTDNNLYNRGSEWRKWDLQVQTILDDGYVSIDTYWDALKTEFPEKCKSLIQKIGSEDNVKKFDSKDYFFTNTDDDEKTRSKNYAKLFLNFIDIFNEDVGAVCITDHNYDHDYLLDALVSEAGKVKIKVISGVEINVNGVHILVLWGGKLYGKQSFSKGVKTFLSKIGVDNKKTNGTLTVSGKSYTEVISEVNSTDGILIYPHCNSDNGLFQERGKTDRTHLADWFNHQKFNILQAQNKKIADITSKYITDNNGNFKSGFVMTLGSDARSLKDILKPDDDENFCWIKADTTFSGLKQITYEPSERLELSKDNPEYKYNKPYFESINILEELSVFEDIQDESQQVYFEKNNISLNKNLVAVIGGRGEGKSLLVNYLAHTFNKYEYDESTDDKFSREGNFKILYSKNNIKLPDQEEFLGNIDNELDFLFIPQNKLKNLSEKRSVGKEIKILLDLEDLYFDKDLDASVKSIRNRIEALDAWFKEEDEDGDLYHSKGFVEKFKLKNKKLLKNITTKENKEKLEKYTKNIKEIKSVENLVLRLNSFSEEVSSILTELNSTVAELNKSFTGPNKIEDFSFATQTEQIKENIRSRTVELEEKEKENSKIKKQFEEGGFSGDLSALLNSAKDYQGNVEWADEKLIEIGKKEKELISLQKERNDVGEDIKNEYERQMEIITKKWSSIIDRIENEEHKSLMKNILADRDISIAGEVVFDKKIFYTKLRDYIDLRSFVSVREDIKIDDIADFSRFINKKLPSYIEGDKKEKTKDDLGRLFFDLQERKDYLYAQPKVTYKGKPLHRLSVGQRGTVYLCLKLATGAFSKPIIFDQPEDDLDNEFIISELIDIFKKLKKYRQIIILTHNANLVVNSDTEQVVVAKNNGEKLAYTSGSLENDEIISSVCNILEGGRDAFKQRRDKYNI